MKYTTKEVLDVLRQLNLPNLRALGQLDVGGTIFIGEKVRIYQSYKGSNLLYIYSDIANGSFQTTIAEDLFELQDWAITYFDL